MPLLLFLALLLTFTTYSSGQYCLCKPGSQAPDPYKKVIDYACGNGASCGAIQSGGPCYQANDVQAICSYAANSYYQNKKLQGATCDFGGVCAPAGSLPTSIPSGCSFPTSGSPGSTGTGTGTGSSNGSTTSTQGGINTVPGSTSSGVFSPMGMGPTGGMGDPNSATQISSYLGSFSLALVLLAGFRLICLNKPIFWG